MRRPLREWPMTGRPFAWVRDRSPINGMTAPVALENDGCHDRTEDCRPIDRRQELGTSGIRNGRILVATSEATTRGSWPRTSKAASSADECDLVEVVAAARAGSGAAWEALVERFDGLVVAIARRCRLSEADVAEVCQTTWLRLVENIDRIEQPDRLAAWLATTSRRESLRIATRHVAVSMTDALNLKADDQAVPVDAGLLKDEEVRTIRRATEQLSPGCRRLLGLLMSDHDLPYKTIAEQLSMPIGSIGPTRGRCLEHLRQILDEMELNQHPPVQLADTGVS
jgi:RNA polymerase sigma factor (sigma-70 family)